MSVDVSGRSSARWIVDENPVQQGHHERLDGGDFVEQLDKVVIPRSRLVQILFIPLARVAMSKNANRGKHKVEQHDGIVPVGQIVRIPPRLVFELTAGKGVKPENPESNLVHLNIQ